MTTMNDGSSTAAAAPTDVPAKADRRLEGAGAAVVQVGGVSALEPASMPVAGAALKAHFAMLARYNRWANARLFGAAAKLQEQALRRDVGLFFGSLHRTLNHILLADRIWLFRLTGEEPEQGPPGRVLHHDFAALLRARRQTDERLVRTVGELADVEVAGLVRFRMADGRDVETTVAAMLSHLFNHQVHHRGQAHAALTILGAASVELDLLLFELECGVGSGVAGTGRSGDAGPVGAGGASREGPAK